MSKTFQWCLDRNKIKTFDKQVFWVDECGDKYWFLNGLLHRENGPACEYADGDKSWWLNGKRHREYGPAIEAICGYKEWWLNGNYYDKPDYWKELKK